MVLNYSEARILSLYTREDLPDLALYILEIVLLSEKSE